jgi:SpoVK/Ycf46/Vps4 family AAA+-type ATPase
VATSNDIASLPPELIRKGRLDEVFFVDLPDKDVRQKIFRIHLKKRDLNPDNFDLHRLAVASEGFSGAEIEQVVVSGLYQSLALTKPLSSEDMLNEISRTSPISTIMAEDVASLRRWAKGRTVSAN